MSSYDEEEEQEVCYNDQQEVNDDDSRSDKIVTLSDLNEEEEEEEDGLDETELFEINKNLQEINKKIKELIKQKENLIKQKDYIKLIIKKRKRKYRESLEPNWKSSTDFPWSRSVQEVAKSVFGFDTLRLGQWEIINSTLSNYDVLSVMKTGGGKSLCYQLPALLNYQTSTTTSTKKKKLKFSIVVSPLLALIRDQVKSMNNIVPGSALSLAGSMDRSQQSAVYQAMSNLQESNLKLLYATPEKIIKSKLLMTNLQKAYNNGSIDRIVIDEVHCASQWSVISFIITCITNFCVEITLF